MAGGPEQLSEMCPNHKDVPKYACKECQGIDVAPPDEKTGVFTMIEEEKRRGKGGIPKNK